MKIAIIGSRNISKLNLKDFLPNDIDEIVSGGAKGVDTIAKKFAQQNNIKITEFLPNYECFGQIAPLKRNIEIIEYADTVLAFWDGKSRGTKYVIDNCKKMNIPINVIIVNDILDI